LSAPPVIFAITKWPDSAALHKVWDLETFQEKGTAWQEIPLDHRIWDCTIHLLVNAAEHPLSWQAGVRANPLAASAALMTRLIEALCPSTEGLTIGEAVV